MIPNKIKTHWNERWVPVITKAPTKNYDYEISNYGRIRNISKETGNEQLLRGSKMNGGLHCFEFEFDWRPVSNFLHSQVCGFAFYQK